MSIKPVFRCAITFAAGALLLAGSGSAQTSSIVKVSNAIEGNSNPTGVTAARCGPKVVVGYGDQEPSLPNSFAGYSVSQDNGVTFKDLGTLPVSAANAGEGGADQLSGFVQVTCVNSSLFYGAALYVDNGNGVPGGGCGGFPICSAISLSISTNGGTTWSLPKVIASASADTHEIVSGAMAVDPANTQRLYVAYLNFNAVAPVDFGFPNCPDANLYELRMASSSDAGNTWADNLVDYACGEETNPNHLGTLATPDVSVSPDSKVYVAYQFIPQTGTPNPPNQIRFAQSLDHGVTFSAPVMISNALGNANPKLAVNRTFSSQRGNIYVTWTGSLSGTNTDVLVSESLDGGLLFSFPRPINLPPITSPGRTQANPVIAVDEDGQVQDCFYNTATSTPSSSSIYSYNCATSFNDTATWQLQRIVNSAPVGSNALATDFLRQHDGFFTAFEVQANGQTQVDGKSDLN